VQETTGTHIPGGQILIVTDGTGYYQEKGKPIQLIRKGDVVNIPPILNIGMELHMIMNLPI
jgi:quercetin dioxygenase-like cupin family protein